MSVLMNEYDINLPQLPGLDLSRVEAEWSRFRSNIPEIWKFNNDGREFQVGDEIKARGLSAEHPVVLIPGVISTVSWTSISFYALILEIRRGWSLGRPPQASVLSSARRCGVGSI